MKQKIHLNKGDLAVIIGGRNDCNMGKIVRVAKIHNKPLRILHYHYEQAVEVEGLVPLKGITGVTSNFGTIELKHLKPAFTYFAA